MVSITDYSLCKGVDRGVAALVNTTALTVLPATPDYTDPTNAANKYYSGFFAQNADAKFRDVTDGLSNTILVGEIRVGATSPDYRGLLQYGMQACLSGNLPPNTPIADFVPPGQCVTSTDLPCAEVSTASDYRHQMTLRSRHTGGAHAALCDGSVRFLGNNIDLTLIRGLSTMAGGEVQSD